MVKKSVSLSIEDNVMKAVEEIVKKKEFTNRSLLIEHYIKQGLRRERNILFKVTWE